ncbi:hypothetical protein [Oceanidesulfovibrio marinus]|uniref:Uncharacterized protein n=1 Tax=Oceanidesulfovibrio marinus TaxID=370038 RepID=A0A6P1ZF08_9BACT|nr:hypothetical protein [Oceanidesulfovibrio marinus]TVM33294.1 hypothetical protein DQK91_11530 [Oceanidesulfovibrio marinus]
MEQVGGRASCVVADFFIWERGAAVVIIPSSPPRHLAQIVYTGTIKAEMMRNALRIVKKSDIWLGVSKFLSGKRVSIFYLICV